MISTSNPKILFRLAKVMLSLVRSNLPPWNRFEGARHVAGKAWNSWRHSLTENQLELGQVVLQSRIVVANAEDRFRNGPGNEREHAQAQ
jgi:hypothetical protein